MQLQWLIRGVTPSSGDWKQCISSCYSQPHLFVRSLAGQKSLVFQKMSELVQSFIKSDIELIDWYKYKCSDKSKSNKMMKVTWSVFHRHILSININNLKRIWWQYRQKVFLHRLSFHYWHHMLKHSPSEGEWKYFKHVFSLLCFGAQVFVLTVETNIQAFLGTYCTTLQQHNIFS